MREYYETLRGGDIVDGDDQPLDLLNPVRRHRGRMLRYLIGWQPSLKLRLDNQRPVALVENARIGQPARFAFLGRFSG